VSPSDWPNAQFSNSHGSNEDNMKEVMPQTNKEPAAPLTAAEL